MSNQCWNCDHKLDGATGLNDPDKVPHPGAVGLCLHCGVIAIYESPTSLRKPTEKELQEMIQDRDFGSNFISFSLARQTLLLKMKAGPNETITFND